MIYQELINLLGYSEFSPEIKAILPKFHIPLDRPEKSICWWRYQSKKWDFSITFLAKYNYIHEHGPVENEYANNFNEGFLEEINFGGTGQGVNYPHNLPYDLSFGDSLELVNQKMPIKKSELNEASYGSYMIFNFEDYWVLTAFNHDQKLIWLRVQQHQKSFKRKRELTKSLRQQNKNLTDKGIVKLNGLKKQTPLSDWTKRMKDGDNNFTANNIEEAQTLLNTFIDSLVVAAEQKKANAIYSATKKITLAFNKLNDKYEGLIETMEREELVEFIHKAIQFTGFKIEPEIDLTEEWREW